VLFVSGSDPETAALETDDPGLSPTASDVVAGACGMSQPARDTGLHHESLYKAVFAEGNPEFITITKIVR
jgi:probable addiction module antidote protein